MVRTYLYYLMDFALLVTPGDKIKHRVTTFRCPCLIENVKWFYGFKFIFLMHVVLGHDFFKFCAGHVHTVPPKLKKKNYLNLKIKYFVK